MKDRDTETAVEAVIRLEQENRILLEQLRESQSVGEVGSWSLEISTGKVTWTDQLFRIFRLEPANTAPSFDAQADLYSVGSWELLQHAIDNAIKHGERFEILLRIHRSDQSKGWILSKCAPIVDQNGQVERLCGSAVDISHAKDIELESKHLAKITNLAIESAKIGVWTVNTNTNEHIWNDTQYEIFGITPEVLQADPNIWMSMVVPEDRAKAEKEFNKIAAGNVVRGIRFKIKRNDGEVRYLECSGSQHVDDENIYEMGITRDVTANELAKIALFRREEELTKSITGTVEMAGRIASQGDPYTGVHELNVARISVAIANQMHLSPGIIKGIEIGAKLHDLGKISIPADILVKPAELNDLEFSLIKTHANTGYEILKGIAFPWPIADIALQHHERLDGSGYPSGLKGDAIILEAKVVPVADVIESMCHHRPFRPALGIEKAVEELTEGAGKLYDPDVVEACLKAIAADKRTFIEN